ncbi:MAG: ATP-dependent dethiobiotin synthetase BioD [Bacteroidia bacterium]|nr:ATP-dependent dethiobiotin synthetase BioD [Bacteroidia bacterium]
MSGKTYFVSGIDTGVGKSVTTGFLALQLKNEGKKVITQKMVQTGCNGTSEDILLHRRIMNEELNEFDRQGLTCPYIFRHPSSPHLAASLENTVIDTQKITMATGQLEQHFEIVLLEGAGGLFVPLHNRFFIIDYIQRQNYPVILVTSPRLGSINLTLQCINICRERKIDIVNLVFNNFPETDPLIFNSTKKFFQEYLKEFLHGCDFTEIPVLNV